MNEPNAPRRLSADAVAAITGLRIVPPDAEAALVNISPTGLLAEAPVKLRVGSAVEVHFLGAFTPPAMAGRVVRCEVAVMGRDGLLRYHLGIEFEATIGLADAEQERRAAQAAAPRVVNRW